MRRTAGAVKCRTFRTHNNLQRGPLYGDFYGRLADIFAVGINVERSPGFHSQALCLEVLHFLEAQVPSKIDCGKHPCEFEGIDAADKADVELAVIHLSAGSDLHAATITGSVGESCEYRGLVAARCPAPSSVGGENLHRERGESKNCRSQRKRVTSMSAQPARQFVGPAGHFAIE